MDIAVFKKHAGDIVLERGLGKLAL